MIPNPMSSCANNSPVSAGIAAPVVEASSVILYILRGPSALVEIEKELQCLMAMQSRILAFLSSNATLTRFTQAVAVGQRGSSKRMA
jgi:hypothetical protein